MNRIPLSQKVLEFMPNVKILKYEEETLFFLFFWKWKLLYLYSQILDSRQKSGNFLFLLA